MRPPVVGLEVVWWMFRRRLRFAVLGAVVVPFLVELIPHRQAHVIGVREAAAWTVVQVLRGVGLAGFLWWYGGTWGRCSTCSRHISSTRVGG
jgi:hypothetical protein